MVLVENDGFQHFGQLKCAFSKATVSGSPPCERCFSVLVLYCVCIPLKAQNVEVPPERTTRSQTMERL